MGCWDCFCFICGNTCHEPLKTDDIDYNVPNIFKKKLKWLNKCTFLTPSNKIIHNCKETDCNIIFKDNKNNKYEQLTKYNKPSHPIDKEFKELTDIGIFLHTDCWMFIKKEYGLELKYGDLPIFYKNISIDKIFSQINYGLIEKYWSQDFNFKGVSDDGNEYLCESPVKNTKNATRIKKIISEFRIKNTKERKSPLTSATFYKEKDIKIGNDNNFWIKSGSRWIKMDGVNIIDKITIKLTDKKQINIIKNIPPIGYYNTKPIFIKSIEKKKKEYVINIVRLKND